ncbi:type II toxin-antitoxin system HicB family antitoxin [Candidatus Gottesmanbacteria bacterium]|nr:type II toxin-antitoxin system HicB family antitoxin [Candidatus Gottesmanbacteria bacterium]
MEKTILNYRIIIEPETYPDGSVVFVAYCPTLGISDYGDSVEEVLKSMKDGIDLAVASLVKDKKEVPVDDIEDQIIATAKVQAPPNIRLAAI